MKAYPARGPLEDGAPREVREHSVQHLDALYTFACWLVYDAQEAEDLVSVAATSYGAPITSVTQWCTFVRIVEE
jgi:hypothetical protein